MFKLSNLSICEVRLCIVEVVSGVELLMCCCRLELLLLPPLLFLRVFLLLPGVPFVCGCEGGVGIGLSAGLLLVDSRDEATFVVVGFDFFLVDFPSLAMAKLLRE